MPTSGQPELPANIAGEEEGTSKMSFFEHLVELRKRLIWAMGAVLLGAVAGLSVATRVFDYIALPIQAALRNAHLPDKLIYTSPTGYINLYITLGLYLGLVLASPVVLYQFWLFVAPGLYKHERKAIVVFLFSSVSLFLGGISFAYFVMLPYTLKFLVSFHGTFEPLITINEYFDLVLMVLLGLGLVFEMPVIIFFLSIFGIVTPQFLWKHFRYAMLIITIIAAIVTPTPDALTMMIFMAPMVALYFLGMGVSFLVVRRKRAAAVASEGAH
jgi:sec-independent protein translocase protein TatC